MSRSRRTLVIAAVAVLVVVALASRAFLAKEATDARYRTEPASRGALVAEVTATGTVNPVTTVQVGTYVSGPIQEIHADFNSHVTKGQLVAKIDPRPFALRVQEAEATLANAHAKVAKARADIAYKAVNLERNKKLRAVVEEGLRSVLARKQKQGPLRSRDASFKGRGLHPDFVARGGWSKLREAAYDEEDEP